VHWRVRPEVCGWQMPSPSLVQDALMDAIAAGSTYARGGRLVTAD
jgi:hypothetical protein